MIGIEKEIDRLRNPGQVPRYCPYCARAFHLDEPEKWRKYCSTDCQRAAFRERARARYAEKKLADRCG